MLVRLLIALIGGVVVIGVVVGLLSFPFWRDSPPTGRAEVAPRTVGERLEGRHAASRGYQLVGLGVIVPVADTPRLLRQCSRATVSPIDGYWRPEREQIEDLERALPAYLEQAGAALPLPLDAYVRQYTGVRSVGRALIYASFLAAEASADSRWQVDVELVCGGGPRFFGVTFDVLNDDFGNLSFNGSK
jgi:hypothetical protein